MTRSSPKGGLNTTVATTVYPGPAGHPGTARIVACTPEEAQAMFVALFPEGYTPKTDTRTPAQLERSTK